MKSASDIASVLATRLEDALEQRRAENSYRSLRIATDLVDFASNDYLGLADNAALYESVHNIISSKYGNRNGSKGSRLLSGNSPGAEELEAMLAAVFKAEACLFFGSGYAANTALLSAIPQKGDTIIYDELIHASLKEGARLSFAQRYSFRHNDLSDLQKKISKATGEVFIVLESVYSMDGDTCPLADVVEVATAAGAHIILDEAHSTGLWGTDGAGMAVEQQLEQLLFARVHTFGKAMGTHGACIAGSMVLKEYLVNFARPFIYTTAPAPHSLAATEAAFSFLKQHPELPALLHHKIALFRSLLRQQKGFSGNAYIESISPIQVVKVSGNTAVRQAADKLVAAGFDVRPILSPTVRKGEERLRICLHAFNTDEQIMALTNELGQLADIACC
jgi:8-amino-7-oxononanoate synthase